MAKNKKPELKFWRDIRHQLHLPKVSGRRFLDDPTINNDVPYGSARRQAILELQLQCESIPEREGWYRIPGTTFEAKFLV